MTTSSALDRFRPRPKQDRAVYTVQDGTPAVTFRGCTAPYAQYQGGFVLDGRRRVTLEAWIDDAPEPERRVIQFGN